MTIVVPSSAGAPSDIIARHLAQSMAAQSRGTFVTDSRPGANGILGVRAVLSAPADGHTLLFTTMSPMVLNRYLVRTLPYDAQADFVPIGLMARSTMWLSVPRASRFQSAQELIDFAKREPSRLNYGYATAVPQLAASMLEQLTGARVTLVSYRAHTAMVTALVTGELDVSITDTASLAPFVESGQARPLASTAPARLPQYPNIPTFRELGVEYDLVAWHGVFVRRGTPPEVVARLTELLAAAARAPELRAYLSANALDDYFVNGPDAAQQVEADVERWGRVTRDAGVVPN
ncbi:Bug family tripartite tricarboxylate transporter substrate binding protein [Muricoccus pecuniae]|uniref:Tripartite-type tricarboxylate transporter receptor subunit TctC n=1 Tax=Muricoccus pecuniae TaxID=693023 RepID=A0A840YIB5_9PROT|nr:tripartite tricarboxylate transporter substrate binding protein [Roseomonas pecuniae]MBB5696231.1 tripartite-type tricarboxylate transporter receptor subunit TctC [Roseomonas pecuniae]